ncbi:flagellar filament capping protein FliD [Paenibacillus athensensis]|uniref:Flagellar hook-associated protein 2 n=1 Tax=Paenibacillus athensensis TaxID=1967502 RepID=A0A4Y8Q4K9_9BACL|nr:flagellar filament capping protein FliD [Paenibacillus athensensis]MCD1260826.1 flagellar filament capping protein FliD [Paenibacillus athensensis]
MVMRLNGFSNSGIDIDDTVSKLMKAARMPQDKLKQQKQTLEWQRDEYRTMNAKIMDFRNAAFNMKLQATYQTKKSSSADESVVSVSASSSATEGIYSIKVNKLAKAASVTSASLGASDGKATLASLGLSGDTTLTVGGEKGTATVTVKSTDTIESLVATVNGKSNITGVSLNYDAAIDKLFFVSSSTGSNSKINLKMQSIGDNDTQNLLATVLKLPVAPANPASAPVPDAGQTVTGGVAFGGGSATLIDENMTPAQKLRISVGSKTVDFDVSKTTTVGKLIDAINSSDIGKTGVSAYLDANNKIAFFNPDDTQSITFSDQTSDSVNVLSKLGLDAADSNPALQPTVTNDLDYSSFSVTGTKAEIEFNGAVAQYDTNTFSINGMTFTAKKEQAPSDAAVNVTNTRDVDTIYNAIKGFIDKYNDLISTINSEVTQKQYRDFQPLTDDQRSEMKDDQIKSWEEKAKSGLLRSDSILTRGLTNFRTSFSNIVQGLPTGNAKSLSEIGISTSLVVGTSISGSYLENGKIYMDDDKLKKAIAEKPDEVMALFNANDGLKDSDSGDGLATRLYDKADALIKQITAKAGATTSVDSSYLMGKTISQMNKRIDDYTTKLDALQTRYYNQFTAMEKYLSQMETQSAQLTQQFG